jgi:L-asparaginase II
MLAVCVHKGWSVEDYYEPDHPVQQLALNNMSELTGFPAESIAIGIDGCGVAVWGVPIRVMAFAFARLADPSGLKPERQRAVRRIVTAVQKHPEMIAGTDRFCSALIEAMRPKVIAKGGAEGVYCVGHTQQALGIALKVEDGNSRGTPPATVAALDQLDLATEDELEQLQEYYHPENTNVREEVVGEIRPAFELAKAEG